MARERSDEAIQPRGLSRPLRLDRFVAALPRDDVEAVPGRGDAIAVLAVKSTAARALRAT